MNVSSWSRNSGMRCKNMILKSVTSRIPVMAFIMTLAMAGSAAQGQTEAKSDPPPVVVTAVAAVYAPIAQAANVTGEVSVWLKIDAKGSVTEVEKVIGHKLLIAGCRNAARQWEFAPLVGSKAERRVEVVFVFKQLPSDALSNKLTTVFKPPYRVEITKAAPPLTTDY